MGFFADDAIVYHDIASTTDHTKLWSDLNSLNRQAFTKWISMLQNVTFCPSTTSAIPPCMSTTSIPSHYSLSRLMAVWAPAMHMIAAGVAIPKKSHTMLTALLESLETSRPAAKLQKNVGRTTKEWRKWGFLFCRIPVVLESRSLSQAGEGVHPLHPPPRSPLQPLEPPYKCWSWLNWTSTEERSQICHLLLHVHNQRYSVTVEPVLSGHPWGMATWPLNTGFA